MLLAPGVSEHLDFVAQNASYEQQLQSAGKAYLDWYMLSQVRGVQGQGSALGSDANGGTPQMASLRTRAGVKASSRASGLIWGKAGFGHLDLAAMRDSHDDALWGPCSHRIESAKRARPMNCLVPASSVCRARTSGEQAEVRLSAATMPFYCPGKASNDSHKVEPGA